MANGTNTSIFDPTQISITTVEEEDDDQSVEKN